jgi:hypothetical protein
MELVSLAHLRRLILMIPLVLFMTGNRPFSGVKEVQEAQETQEDQQSKGEVGSNRKPGTRKRARSFGGFENRFKGEASSFTGMEGRGVG